MSESDKVLIFLLDDHAVLLEGLTILINKEPDMEVCGTASDGPSAMSKLFSLKPDIIIVDLTLENSNGLDFIKCLKARYDDVRVLVLTMHDELVFAERCIRAGASGYIMKSESPSAIIDAMRLIMKGKIYLSPKMTQHVVLRAMNPKEKSDADSVENLSDREFQVFQYIGEGITSKDMASKLNLSIKTIDSVRENIKHKIGLESAAELTKFAIKWIHSDKVI
ncbi:response regulator transcription factor [Seleniivibrio sp.]|uniref:response regulator transcription factor n=1 Tax=Seleniivibrio sp. TaxID=2898801 RepID=UPI0025F17749|nr:response regulator transcription factor [Seleniivibrio sp.]MCD8554160.1 response regulator transcription factor [Seleniivibrio sp.]